GMGPPRAARDRSGTAAADSSPDGSRVRNESDDDLARLRTTARGPLEKSLVLTAREANPAGDAPPRTLWHIELSTTDLSNDLRKYLPLLAAVAVEEIGVDSGGPKTVSITENNKTVTLLKK